MSTGLPWYVCVRKSAASSCAGMRWNQITLPVLLMISGPLTLPPAGVMKISPLPLSAPCFSTMTAGAFARTAAPEVTVVHAAPAKAMTAATAAAAPARGALFRREPATRHETPLSPIAQLHPSGSHHHDRPLPSQGDISPAACSAPVFLTGADPLRKRALTPTAGWGEATTFPPAYQRPEAESHDPAQ